MSKTPQDTGDGEDLSTEKIRELIDRGSGDSDLNQILFEELLDEQAQEFANAKPIEVDELTDDELAEMKKDEAEINQQLKRKARYDKARHNLRFGIKLKVNDPESKLFRTAEELLTILDKAEADPTSVSQLEKGKYKTGLVKYNTLLEAEIKNRITKTNPAEVLKDIPGEHRTSPMSQTELANLYGGDMTQKKIRAMICSGTLRVITQSRQVFIFDKRQLPPHVKEKLKNLEQS